MRKQIVKRLTKAWIVQVYSQFNEHKITEQEARELLGLKRSRFYELRKQWLRQKDSFDLKASGTTGRRSLAPKIQDFLHQELRYIKEQAYHYRGKYNFAFLSEKIEKAFEVSIHRNTIRRFALNQGYYEQTTTEKQKPRIRFEMDAIGALFQHDTSRHVWLPLSGRYHDVLMTKDDHSRRVVAHDLREIESAWLHIRLARETFEMIGLPLAYYVDKHSIFKFNLHESIHYTRRISEEEGKVQFKRALASCGVSVLYAHDAQSKGKIEKQFDYFQRRLPQECERYKIKSVKQALPILNDLVHFYNTKRIHQETGEIPIERWNRAIKEGRSRLRPVSKEANLDPIFSLHFQRTVKSDGTFLFQGNTYFLKQCPRQIVTVAWIPAKKLMALKNNQLIGQYHFQGHR